MKRFLPFILFLPVLISCEKELDFKYHDVEPQFVIEGNLTEKGSTVSLSYTIPMDEAFPSENIVDAEVSLRDLTYDISYTLVPEEGKFKSPVPGIPNHNYELVVNRNGNLYSSTCLMRGGIEIKNLKLQWIKMPYDYVAILEIVSSVLDLEGTCYWTRIYKNGEPYKWLVSHGSGAIDGELIQTTFTSRQNPKDEDDKRNLKDGDVLEVMVFPISLDMYDYVVGISSDSNGPSMFKGDFCLGYFLASEGAESSIVFNTEDIPYYP